MNTPISQLIENGLESMLSAVARGVTKGMKRGMSAAALKAKSAHAKRKGQTAFCPWEADCQWGVAERNARKIERLLEQHYRNAHSD
jgi:hypothetical protein